MWNGDTTDVPPMCYLDVTIEEVILIIEVNFEVIILQTLVPYHLVINSRLEKDWQCVKLVAVTILD